jgi:hypothetical protein
MDAGSFMTNINYKEHLPIRIIWTAKQFLNEASYLIYKTFETFKQPLNFSVHDASDYVILSDSTYN